MDKRISVGRNQDDGSSRQQKNVDICLFLELSTATGQSIRDHGACNRSV